MIVGAARAAPPRKSGFRRPRPTRLASLRTLLQNPRSARWVRLSSSRNSVVAPAEPPRVPSRAIRQVCIHTSAVARKHARPAQALLEKSHTPGDVSIRTPEYREKKHSLLASTPFQSGCPNGPHSLGSAPEGASCPVGRRRRSASVL